MERDSESVVDRERAARARERKALRHAASLAFSAAALFFGCAQAPETEIAFTRSLLDSVRALHAETVTPILLSQAQDSLDAALKEVSAKRSRFAFPGAYAHVKHLLAASERLARLAADSAIAHNGRERAQTDSVIGMASVAIARADTLLQSTLQAKREASGAGALPGALDSIRWSLQKASVAESHSEYDSARDIAFTAAAQADSITTLLLNATRNDHSGN